MTAPPSHRFVMARDSDQACPSTASACSAADAASSPRMRPTPGSAKMALSIMARFPCVPGPAADPRHCPAVK